MALVLNYDEKSLDKRESLWNFQFLWSNLTVDFEDFPVFELES